MGQTPVLVSRPSVGHLGSRRFVPAVLAFYLAAAGFAANLSQYGGALPGGAGKDSAFFVASGVMFANGRLPYTGYWDLKPPVVHELAAVVSLLVGDEPRVVFVALGLVGVVLATATVALVADAAVAFTGSEWAGVAAGFTVLTVPEAYLLPVVEVEPRWLLGPAVALTLWLIARERPALALGAAALAAATWQPGIGMVVVALIACAHRGRIREGVAAAAGVFLLVMAPWLLTGTLDPVVAQTVVAPLVTEAPGSVRERVSVVLSFFGPSAVVLVLGTLGAGRAERLARSQGRSIGAISASIWWFGGYLLAMNADGAPDVVALLVVLAVGVGVLVAGLPAPPDGGDSLDPRLLVVGLVAALVLLRLPWLLGSPGFSADTALHHFLDTGQGCHVRMSHQERWWIQFARKRAPITACGDVDWLALLG